MIILPTDSIPIGSQAVSVTLLTNRTDWRFLAGSAIYSITTESDVIVEHLGEVVDTVHSGWRPRVGEGIGVLAHDITQVDVAQDGMSLSISLTEGWRITFLADDEDENKLYVRKIVSTDPRWIRS